MAEISLSLSLSGRRQVARDLADTNRDLNNTKGALDRVKNAGKGIASGIGSGIATIGKLGAAGVAGISALGIAAGGAGIKTAAAMEQANISFTTMLGSGEKAQSFITDLSNFAAKTPFDFPGLQTAASSLVSAGIDADKVIPIMTSLGNATSGMGTGAEGIQRATVALQQMNAAQKISGEDLNQLRDAGIPVFDLLASATGKSTEAIAEMAAKGKLGKQELDQLMTALESGKGLERFNGLMDKQSQSLSGMASTFKDTLGMGLAKAMEPSIPFLKIILTDANALLTKALPGITAGVAKVTNALAGTYAIMVHGDYDATWWGKLGVYEDSGIIDKMFRIRDGAIGVYNILFKGDYTSGMLSAFGAAGDEDGKLTDILFRIREGAQDLPALFARIGPAVSTAWAALSGVDFTKIGEGIKSFGDNAGGSAVLANTLQIGSTLLGTALTFLSDHMDTIIKYMPYIVAGFALWRAAQQAQVLLTLAQLPLQVANIVVNYQLAAANMALARALGFERTSRLRNIAATIAGTAAKVKDLAIITLLAIRVAAWYTLIGIVTIAQKIWTAGQWLLNAALSANPIGIVIGVIALLVGGIILAYKKSDTFRGIVDGLWSKIKEGGVWIRDVLWPIIKDVLVSALDSAKGKFNDIKDSIGGFIDKIKSAYNWVKDLINMLKTGDLAGFADKLVNAIPGGGAVLDFFGGRAEGGNIQAGRSYLVGEEGPEFITPSSSGYVHTAPETRAMLTPQVATLKAPAAVSGLSAADEDELSALDFQPRWAVYLDGKEMHRSVVKTQEKVRARQ